MLHFLTKIARTRVLTCEQHPALRKGSPKRLEHARVQGGGSRCSWSVVGIEKAGPRVETTALCNDGLCLISPRVQFKCGGDWRRSGAKAVMMVRVCLISVEGEQNIVTAWLDWRRRCGPNSIFPYLSKFMNSWILEWKRMLWFIIVSTINSFQTF